MRVWPPNNDVEYTTRAMFEWVQSIVGTEYITEQDSLFAEIGEDEYMVAMKCGPTDCHYIPYINGVVYNKQGTTDMAEGCTVDCITADEWKPHFHTWGQNFKYALILWGNTTVYDDETIYFSIKRGWDDE